MQRRPSLLRTPLSEKHLCIEEHSNGLNYSRRFQGGELFYLYFLPQVRIEAHDKRAASFVDRTLFAGTGHALGQKPLPLAALGGPTFTLLTPRG